MSHSDLELYRHWQTLLEWMQAYAEQNGLRYERVSDFPDYIYRMERPYDLPTHVASAAINAPDGQSLLVAAVSPRHVALKSVQLRLMGGSKHWHFHANAQGLVEGKQQLTKERFFALAAQARSQVTPA